MFLFIFEGERERESMSRGGPEREGDTESEAGSRLWAISTEPDAVLKLTNCEIMTWAEVGCLTDWATQAPLHFKIFKEEIIPGQASLPTQNPSYKKQNTCPFLLTLFAQINH